MKKSLMGIVASVLVVSATGCASSSIVGTGVTRVDRFYGDVGITGSNNNLTILSDSRVSKLSILGNNCTVTVQDGVMLYRVEFWGKGNTVSIPETLVVRTTEVGSNQIIRRPREQRHIFEWERLDDRARFMPPEEREPAVEPTPEFIFEPVPPPQDVEPTEPSSDEIEYEALPPVESEQA